MMSQNYAKLLEQALSDADARAEFDQAITSAIKQALTEINKDLEGKKVKQAQFLRMILAKLNALNIRFVTKKGAQHSGAQVICNERWNTFSFVTAVYESPGLVNG